ncbi:MAG: Hpt domain-containing protein [Bacteroidota bacterium]|nr:Hpt domain-containing protein [Candidatus Kapabacteria bacterium]MDW8219581.1 Hpt domain-containing protein [Bacteroidota bacterium]
MTLPEDPIVLELLPEFILDWLQQIEAEFHDILEAQDEQRLYRLGHTLKGSCLQFGLETAAQLGITLMEHSKSQNWEAARAMYEPIRNYFLEAQTVLQAKGLMK